MRFADVRTEWRVDQIENALNRKAEDHEIHALRSTVDSLEYTCRELRAEADGFRYELQELQNKIEEMIRQNETIKE